MKSIAKLLPLLLVAGSPLQAQSQQLSELRADVELFSAVLAESLGLNESSGLFGMSLGGVQSTYLQGQGLVIELRSPLANRRNRLGLAALNNALQNLQMNSNPLEAIRRNTEAVARTSALALNESVAQADSFYQEMMDKIAAVDFSLVVNTAVEQAGNSLRSLRSLGEISDEEFARLQAEVNDLRQQLQNTVEDLRELEQQALDAADDSTDAQAVPETMMARLDQLVGRFEPLREAALNKARELQDRNDAAEQRYARQWQADLDAFETRLYTTLCDYGASLRALPGDETVALILRNLGDDAPDNSSMDKIHVLKVADMQACQRGAIDSDTLRSQSLAYSY
jgi:chromosome segregation ATPase